MIISIIVIVIVPDGLGRPLRGDQDGAVPQVHVRVQRPEADDGRVARVGYAVERLDERRDAARLAHRAGVGLHSTKHLGRARLPGNSSNISEAARLVISGQIDMIEYVTWYNIIWYDII